MLSDAFATFTLESGFTLLLLVIFIPILVSLGIFPIHKKWGRRGVYIASLAGGFLPFVCLLFYVLQYWGTNSTFLFSGFLNLQLFLAPDAFGLFLAMITSLIWFAAIYYGVDYMEREHGQPRFFFFFLLTQGGILGVFLAGDLFSLFLFFEFMTLASFPLVIHEQTEKAQYAGRQYLFLGVLGGLFILLGLFILYHQVGTLTLSELQGMGSELGESAYIILPALFLGFAIKAGLVPLHIWLPQAHPVAPTPASAVLSGLLIKTGVFGIIRIIYTIAPLDWLAQGLFWLGLLTLVFGSLMAYFESSSKKILAYSSVSQIGYITVGLGAGAIMGSTGYYGALGGAYHILNHALFKASLFMSIGYVYVQTHELNIYRLGGLWKKMPITALLAIVGGLGLVGFPLFNGFPSKTLIHHGITYAEAQTGLGMYGYAEMLFNLGAAGTLAYTIKLIYNVFFRGPREVDHRKTVEETRMIRPLFVVLALVMVVLGLFPTRIFDGFILPMAALFNLDVAYATKQVGSYAFFSGANLLDAVKVMGLGFFLYGVHLYLLKRKVDLPRSLSIEALLYRPVVRVLGNVGRFIHLTFENSLESGSQGLTRFFKGQALPTISNIDGRMDSMASPSDVIMDGLTDYLTDRQDTSLRYLDFLFEYWQKEGESEDPKSFWNWLAAEEFLDREQAEAMKKLLEGEILSPWKQKQIEKLLESIAEKDVKDLLYKYEEEAGDLERGLSGAFSRLLEQFKQVAGDEEEGVENKRPEAREKGFKENLQHSLSRFMRKLHQLAGEGGFAEEETEETEDGKPQSSPWARWNLMNLNFDMIVLGITLVVAVIFFLLFAQI